VLRSIVPPLHGRARWTEQFSGTMTCQCGLFCLRFGSGPIQPLGHPTIERTAASCIRQSVAWRQMAQCAQRGTHGIGRLQRGTDDLPNPCPSVGNCNSNSQRKRAVKFCRRLRTVRDVINQIKSRLW
jgi:hypothetical protein